MHLIATKGLVQHEEVGKERSEHLEYFGFGVSGLFASTVQEPMSDCPALVEFSRDVT